MYDKEMLVYPTLATIANLFVLIIAYYYFRAIGILDANSVLNYTNVQWISGAGIALATMYAAHFIYSFFECALVASAIKRLRGDNPTVGYGLGLAANRMPQIAGWSLYSTLFGILVSLLKSFFKNRWAQKAVGGLAETTWNVVTVFVLPLVVVENMGPTRAMKQSVKLVKQKWGEAATLELGFGTLCSLAAVPIAFLFILSGFLQQSNSELALTLMILGVASGAFLGLIFTALNGISKAVLYNFAVGGNLPEEIHNSTLNKTVVCKEDHGSSAQGHIHTNKY
ncbi:MAG: DUF6159 family protein [Rhizobiaceae bacterium]